MVSVLLQAAEERVTIEENTVLAAVENDPFFFEVAFHGCSVKMH
jgi:hypothetical protein